MTQRIIIIGTGGNSYDLLDIIDSVNEDRKGWEVSGFLDDTKTIGERHANWGVLGRLRDANTFPDCLFANAIGSPSSYAAREEIVSRTRLQADQFANLIHARCSISARAKLGRGVAVNYGAGIAGAVTVGDHVSVGPGCIIGHGASIGDYSMVAAGAVVSGSVEIGSSCYIGAGSVIREGIRIGKGALVGMGAVVLRDVDAATTVVGNPARLLIRGGNEVATGHDCRGSRE